MRSAVLEPFELLPILLAPVAALLFLDLLHSRRLRYPHDLLAATDRRGPASLFFRSLRRRYDVVLDAAMAVALAFALPASSGVAPASQSAARGRRAAVVLDCSRSMLAGERGARPLDAALARLADDPALAEADAFALAFDPESMDTRLVPLSRIATRPDRARGEATDGIAAAIEGRLSFFAVDYDELADLRRRGYGPITLLTDRLGRRTEGLSVVESGFAVSFAAYPASARYDRNSESWVAALAESGRRGAVSVFSWDEKSYRFLPLATTRYAIEESAGGRNIRFAESGLYLVSLKDPSGGAGIEIPLRFRPSALRVSVAGPFSERMAAVFPLLERSPGASVALRDAGAKALGAEAKTAIVTALLPGDGILLLDPALSAGRPIAAGAAIGADFALCPSSLANEDLPLAYDSAISNLSPPAFLTAVPRGARSLIAVGGSFLARTADGLVPLIAPASEHFEARGGPPLALPPPAPRRLGWALLLAALAAAKLTLRKMLSAKD